MEQITGIVEDAGSKDVTTKYGEKKVYHVVVDGETFKNGFKKPRCAVGDTVAISFEETQYGNEISAISVSAKGDGGATPTPTVQSSGASAKGNNVQAAIIRQNCVGNARELVVYADSQNDKDSSIEQLLMDTIKTASLLEKYCDGSLSAKDLTTALSVALQPTADEE